MPLSFAKKTPAATAPAAKTAQSATPSNPAKSNPPKSGGMSFLKRGQAAREVLEKEEEKSALMQESYGKLWRFFMKPNDDEVSITFIDGDLDQDGILDTQVSYEHRVQFNGNTEHFLCTADVDKEVPCPLCERGDTKSEMVAYLTVIDHTHRVSKKTQKVSQHKKKLFVFKKTTLKLLTNLAKKRGGLSGCTFDVTRSGEKSPSVGDAFDFTEKQSLADVQAKYKLTGEDIQPADYGTELSYRTPAELIKLGVGKAPGGIGYEKGVSDKASKADLANEL